MTEGLRDLVGIGVGGVNGLTIGALGIGILLFILIAAIWGAVWKGLALWKSARKNHLVWFIVMLVVNTVGILEILYIYVFSERGKKAKKK